MRWSRGLDPRVREALDGSRDERLLAWGELVDGSVVVCTDQAIHFPVGRRVAWDLVVRGAWSEEFLDLVVQAEPGAATEQVRLRFEEPAHVPAVVRERVEWTVMGSHPTSLMHPDGRVGSATLNARRSPATGEVRWAVVFDADIDPQDPGWRQAADAALVALREQLGI
jgi:hypothetical protein